jgi:hypothetical protein
VKDVLINGLLGMKKNQESVQNVKVLIGTNQEREKLKGGRNNMAGKFQLVFWSQIVNSMEEAAVKLKTAHENKNQKDFEEAKKLIIEFQQRLSKELKGVR